MSEIVNSRYQGILIPDERFNLDNLTDEDHATAPSSYDQASPKPGVPVSEQSTRMVLQASGEQPARTELGIHSLRAGHPGLERAGYLWYDASEAEPEEFGWDGPQIITGWQSLFWSSDATEIAAYPDLIRLDSGKLLALGLQDKTTFAQTVKRYDPDAVTKWSTAGTFTPDTATAQLGPALCQLPSGRVLAFIATGTQIDVYFSDDDGSTWEPYSYRSLDVAVAHDDVRQLRAEYSAGEVLLLVQYEAVGTGRTCAQYASDDLGARFTQIEADWKATTAAAGSEERPSAIDIVDVDGAFLVTYHHTPTSGSGNYRSRRIGSAFEKVTDATAAQIAPGCSIDWKPGGTAWRDDSGVVFFIYTRIPSASGSDLVPRRSTNAGDSWEQFDGDGGFFSGNFSNGHFHSYSAESIAGQAVLLARWFSETADEDPQSLAAVYLGGFSTHTAPAGEGITSFFDTEYCEFNKDSVRAISGGSWLPIANPSDVAWTATGTGSDTLTSGKLAIVTAADTRYSHRDATEDDDGDRLFAEIALEVDDGDGLLTSTQIGALFRLGDGVNVWNVSINVSSSGWALYDIATGLQIGGTVTEDLTKSIHIRVALDQGKAKTCLLYSSPSPPDATPPRMPTSA